MQDFNPSFMFDRPYHTSLPEDLEPLHFYLADSGHVIMCVIESFINQARETSYDDYECGLPVKYVLENGYTMENGYCVVDVHYDENFGAIVDDDYNEY